MRIVFMGTPGFALPTLKALHNSDHEIVAVYTQPPRPAGRGQRDTPSPVYEFAEKNNLTLFTPLSLKSKEEQEKFASHKADIAVVVAYGLLLPKPILEAYPMGCINVHPSKLPRWRGAAPIQRTVMAGDKETAIIIMQMDEGLDTGDILLAKPYEIADGTNAGELHDKLANEAAPMVLEALKRLADKTITPVKQQDTGVEYAKKITKEECRIDWNRPAAEINQKILGLSPSPGAYFMHNGENIKIFEANLGDCPLVEKPGTILDKELGIACNPGALHPQILQRPGKKRMSLPEFLHGFNFNPGDKVS